MSYDGKLHIGLNADYEMVPDIGILTALLAQAFMAISDASLSEKPKKNESIKKKMKSSRTHSEEPPASVATPLSAVPSPEPTLVHSPSHSPNQSLKT